MKALAHLVVVLTVTMSACSSATPGPPSLEGTSWTVTAVAGRALVPGTELTADFTADGSVTGAAGCNQFKGSYETDGVAITVGPVAATKRLCAEPEGVMEQEGRFLEVLGAATSFNLTGDRLELSTAGGVTVVMESRGTS